MENPTLQDFEPFSDKEKEVLAGLQSGITAKSGQQYPESATAGNTVRAELLYFLALTLSDSGLASARAVVVSDAWITGVVDFNAMKVARSLRFVRCNFASRVDFRDADINGSLQFSKCNIPGIFGNRLRTTSALIVEQTIVRNTVFLEHAVIGGGLRFDGTKFLADGTTAICARGISIRGDVLWRNGSAHGSVEFPMANVTGQLDAKGTTFDCKLKPAFNAEGAEFGGDFSCTEIKASGEIRLIEANMQGGVDFSGASIVNEGGDALVADRIVVRGLLLLVDNFAATGAVRIPGSRINNDVYFDAASLRSTTSCCLMAENAQITGDLRFTNQFAAHGQILLSGMVVSGDLDMNQASFESTDGRTITAEGISVRGTFSLKRMITPLHRVSFRSSEFGRLADEEKSWGEELELDGLRYGVFAGEAPTDARSRLRWLDKQIPQHAGKQVGGFKPQPWHYLRRTLLEMGHFEDAREIGIAYETRIRSVGLIGQTSGELGRIPAWMSRILATGAHRIFGALIGYGYRPARLVMWLFSVWFVSGMFYWYAALNGVMAPSNPIVFQSERYKACLNEAEGGWYLCSDLPEEYTGFSPLAYSLDVLLPFVDLQQEKDWAPKVPAPQAVWYSELRAFSLKHAVRFVVWFEIIFGWIAGVLLVAVVSGLTKRADE